MGENLTLATKLHAYSLSPSRLFSPTLSQFFFYYSPIIPHLLRRIQVEASRIVEEPRLYFVSTDRFYQEEVFDLSFLI